LKCILNNNFRDVSVKYPLPRPLFPCRKYRLITFGGREKLKRKKRKGGKVKKGKQGKQRKIAKKQKGCPKSKT
jgi:hypothetical protein